TARPQADAILVVFAEPPDIAARRCTRHQTRRFGVVWHGQRRAAANAKARLGPVKRTAVQAGDRLAIHWWRELGTHLAQVLQHLGREHVLAALQIAHRVFDVTLAVMDAAYDRRVFQPGATLKTEHGARKILVPAIWTNLRFHQDYSLIRAARPLCRAIPLRPFQLRQASPSVSRRPANNSVA